jgi:Ca2+-binding EF-hand superfamily protein
VAGGARASLDMPTRAQRDEVFRRMDYNGNGALSLAEIDKAVVELWPEFNHKPALMRAYKAADRNGDGFIKRREFRLLLRYVMYFNELWHKFEEIDVDDDRRLSLDEFMVGCEAVGHSGLSREEASREFEEMDSNHGGVVLFDEFCAWCAERHVAQSVHGAARATAPRPTLARQHGAGSKPSGPRLSTMKAVPATTKAAARSVQSAPPRADLMKQKARPAAQRPSTAAAFAKPVDSDPESEPEAERGVFGDEDAGPRRRAAAAAAAVGGDGVRPAVRKVGRRAVTTRADIKPVYVMDSRSPENEAVCVGLLPSSFNAGTALSQVKAQALRQIQDVYLASRLVRQQRGWGGGAGGGDSQSWSRVVTADEVGDRDRDERIADIS